MNAALAADTDTNGPAWVTVFDRAGDYIFLGDPDGPEPPLGARWLAEPKPGDATKKQHQSRFAGMWPDEYETMPDLDFWDRGAIPDAPDLGVLPRFPEGAVVVMYAKPDHHKTNILLTMLIEAALERGARVCYAAGEGSYGVGKQRIKAHCGKRGVSSTALRGKFRLVSAVPAFGSSSEVREFIEANGISPQTSWSLTPSPPQPQAKTSMRA